MYDFQTQELRLEIWTRWGQAEATVSRNELGLEIKVTDHSAKDTYCVYEGDELRSRSRGGTIRGVCPPWVLEGPVYETLSPEIREIALKAMEEFLRFEWKSRT